VEFEWDRRKAERNLRKHGVSFDEAVTLFADPFELMVDDPDHSFDEERFVSVGRSALDRLLVVGYSERGSKIWLIFSRPATCPNDWTMRKLTTRAVMSTTSGMEVVGATIEGLPKKVHWSGWIPMLLCDSRRRRP
jgi:uncharacterized DUF497 family protein